MLALIIISVILLALIGLCLYGIFMPKLMIKQSRIVDARVISCEKRSFPLGEETDSFYEVTVDFYGIYGEAIQKQFVSEEYLAEGTVIRSRYIDKTGRFMQNVDEDVKNNGGLWVVIGFLVFFLALMLSIILFQDENGEMPDWLTRGVCYAVSFIFMGVGFIGIRSRIKLMSNRHRKQVIPGYLVDYTVHDGDSDGVSTYQPIFEYELMGIKYRYQGNVSGNAKKYRTIGRKVHMLRDCETGEVVCQEDEKALGGITLVFGVIGLALFLFLLADNLGMFPETEDSSTNVDMTAGNRTDEGEDSKSDSVLTVYVMYPEGEEKCSYCIEISEFGLGEMILFPTVAVSGKGIDQYISFKIPISDIVRIGSWIEEAEVENLAIEKTDSTSLTVTVYVTEGEVQYGGRGTLDMQPYAELYELLSEIVPAKVWEEMQKREEEYYR